MRNILLTGATGEVGSQLALKLKNEGHNVYCLVRSTSEESAQSRIDSKLGLGFTVVEGDIHQDLCALNHKDLTMLKGSISKVIHSAALVKFNESLREKTFCTNFTGTKNVIQLAKTLEIPEFHYISTAYVAGDTNNFSEQDVGLKQNARNPYEESKQLAESLVRTSEIPYSIYRLGVVVGHSETGETDTYNGYYGYFSTIWQIREKLHEAAEKCVFQMPTNLDCTINLIQRNWVQDTLFKLITKDSKNQCYHLTHPSPPKVGWVLETSYKHLDLPIKPVMIYSPPENPSKNWNIIQRSILREVKKYNVYTTREAVFSNCTLKKTLGKDYIDPKPITKEQLHLLLGYAQRTSFGRQELLEPVIF